MELTLDRAREILLQVARPMPKEYVPLEQCRRRVLAETITADIDFPPFNRSPLDGYAVIAETVRQATLRRPVILRQTGNISAGMVADGPLTEGTACRIMTGAPLPLGATGVVRLEDTRVLGDLVYVLDGRGAEKNLCLRGEEIVAGEAVMEAGAVINAGAMGMLALLGKTHPLVFSRPRVVVIATGSEILPVDAPLTPGKIRNSNSYMLNGQVYDAGGQVVRMSSAHDNVDEIADVMKIAPECDLVITIGGASVGDYDLIGQVYKAMSVSPLFCRVRMKPGMHVLAGVKDGRLYLGLSGNPAAAAISFENLARPVLMKMSGRQQCYRPRVQAVLAAPFNKTTDAIRFVWARCWQKQKEIYVEPLKHSSSGMLRAAIVANSLIVIPENSPPLPVGTPVEAILLMEP